VNSLLIDAEACAAVLAAGAAVGLLEGLEDQVLLVRRNADSGVAHGEGHASRQVRPDSEADAAVDGELERVGEEVLQHLLEAAGVGAQGGRQRLVHGDGELQTPVLRHLAERALQIHA
jgi:hypothetical protein